MAILDVGCGSNLKGDVSVDLELETIRVFVNHRNSSRVRDVILADGNHLPFRENHFDKVVSHHVIEHTKTPLKFLKELIRVSKNEVEIKCPHKYSRNAKTPYHVSYFSKTWFSQVCSSLQQKIRFDVSASNENISIGFFVFPFFRPHEITLTIRKI